MKNRIMILILFLLNIEGIALADDPAPSPVDNNWVSFKVCNDTLLHGGGAILQVSWFDKSSPNSMKHIRFDQDDGKVSCRTVSYNAQLNKGIIIDVLGLKAVGLPQLKIGGPTDSNTMQFAFPTGRTDCDVRISTTQNSTSTFSTFPYCKGW